MAGIKSTGIDGFMNKLKRGVGKEIGRKIYLEKRKKIEDFGRKELARVWSGHDVNIVFTKVYAGFKVDVTGEDVLFLEYGTGIKYAHIRHPNANAMGYGAGTYNPDSEAWKNPDGWYYKDSKTGAVEHTYGNPAYAYTYNTRIKILDRIYTEFGMEAIKEW